MSGDDIDDQILMAYVDGELDASEVARVEAVLNDDPEMARRLSVFSGTRDALRSAAAVQRQEAVPSDVVVRAQAAIDAASRAGDDKVIPFRSTRASRVWPAAIAASLALASFLGGYAIAPERQGTPSGDLRFAILDTPDVSAALDRLPAGERTPVEGGDVAVVASFRDADGAFCREFAVDTADLLTVVSVACRAGDRWNPQIAVVTAGNDDTQYAPASSLETMDAYLTAIGAGAPLSPEEEATVLDGLDG